MAGTPLLPRLQGLAPVVGSEGGSAWFGPDQRGEFPSAAPQSELAHGLSILLDSQPATTSSPMDVFFASDAGGHVVLTLNDPAPGSIAIDLAGPDGRFRANARTSASAAKRVLISVAPATGVADVYEIQPWATDVGSPRQCDISVEVDDRPTLIGPLEAGAVIGGTTATRPFSGRVANLAIWTRALDLSSADRLSRATDNPFSLSHSDLGALSAEMVELFLDDVAQLREITGGGEFTPRSMRLAASVMSRWLLDGKATGRAMLREVGARLGIQTWFPGESEGGKRLEALMKDHGATFYVRGDQGLRGPGARGVPWILPEAWLQELAFMAGGSDVTNGQFIKFVRNKLGGGHFDEANRTRWQRTLGDMAASLHLNGISSLSFQMRAMASTCLDAAEMSMIPTAILPA